MMNLLPTVAIVGRPNVGKSTLFNYLTHSQDALTSAHPGTTRDRQFGTVNLYHRHFIIIDTGGMLAKASDIDQLITQQALQAAQEADKVLLLVDAKQGILPEDKWLADQLRRTGKPLFLAVNKTEGLDAATSIAESYELGLPTPIAIAATQGRGVKHLIETLFPDKVALSTEQESISRIKLAIVGRPNAGKSTLINRMLGEERMIVHDSSGTTRDSIFISLERFNQHYTLIDTAGVRKRKKVTEPTEKDSMAKTLQAIHAAHVVLYVIDGRLAVSEQDLKLLSFVLKCGKALTIAINKWDGMTEEARQCVRLAIDRQLDFVTFARIHYISARHGSGVGHLFHSIDEAYHSATKKLSTPLLTRLLQLALLHHSPPLIHGRRIKLRYAHPGGYHPPTIIIHGNQVHALPETYRRYLAHFYQTKLNLVGTPVQVEFKSNHNPFI